MELPSATPEPDEIKLGGNAFIIFVAYFYMLVFAIWTARGGNSIFRSDFQSVRHARERGVRQITYASLAIFFMGVYIYAQSHDGDYKEMFAALLALSFALIQVMRTIFALWHLCVFKHWAMASMKSMETLGYRALVGDADNLLVSNSSIHCGNLFRMQLISSQEEKIANRERSAIKRMGLKIWYALRGVLRLCIIFLALIFQGTSPFPNAEVGPRLLPRNPEKTWLRWASLLVAQTGWMRHLGDAYFPASRKVFADCDFAEQILMAAALHCRSSEVLSGARSFLDWKRYPQLREGKFSKEEFLQYACKSGHGFPYKEPHRCDSYKIFAEELRASIEALGPEFAVSMDSFSTEMVEWLAIFFSVEKWLAFYEIENHGVSGGAGFVTCFKNDIPIENLRMQLGFSHFDMSRFKLPLLRNIHKKILWGNRNVLEASCHVDNWLALSAGQKISMSLVPSREQSAHVKSALGLYATTFDVYEGASAALKENIEFQVSKFLSHMIIAKPKDGNFEKSMTFLGCSMEMLRSSLAIWNENTEQMNQSVWKVGLGARGDSQSAERNPPIQFDSSDDLTACLRTIDSRSGLMDRYLQMRIIWELQNHFHKNHPEGRADPNSHQAMILCLLSFPALSVDAEETSRTQNTQAEDKFEIYDYEYLIRATSGPQKVHVRVSFSTGDNGNSIVISAQLEQDEEEEDIQFCWEIWRDSFYGRLEGSRLCQKKMGIPHAPLLRTSNRIWAGIERVQNQIAATGPTLNVWKGWLPLRATICKYEIATAGFIMQYQKEKERRVIEIQCGEGTTKTFRARKDIWNSVAYAKANSWNFKHATLVGQILLQAVAEGESITGNLVQDTYKRALEHKRKGNITLALVLLEFVAIEMKDTKALKHAKSLLQSEGCTREYFDRVIWLLERFYIFYGSDSDSATWNIGQFYRFCEDEQRVEDVATLFEKLLHESKYDPLVSERYQIFLLMLCYNSNVAHFESSYLRMVKSLI